MKKRLVLILSGVALLLSGPSLRAEVEVGTPTPEIEATFPDGRTVTLSSLKGQVVLVYFWATWCMPCVADLPNLRQIHSDYRDRPFAMLGVTTEPQDEVAAFLEEHQVPWPNYFDTRYTSWDIWSIRGLPVKFFIGQDGTLVEREEGSIPPEELRRKIDSLLKAAAAEQEAR